MDPNVEGYYKVLIHNYLSGQANDKDIESLMLWIEQSDDNKKQFTDYKRIWELTLIAAPSGKISQTKYEEWEKVSKELPYINTSKKNKFLIQKSALERLIRIAAIVLIFLMLIFELKIHYS